MTERSHDTPPEIARALTRWAPRQTKTLLEPAAGIGALLTPLLGRLAAAEATVVCVDVDRQALHALRTRVRRASPDLRLHTVSGDFLSGRVQRAVRAHSPQFDCVVLNPPFLGREVHQPTQAMSGLFAELRSPMPPEAYFLANAVELLRPGGRALAILPASVITGDRCAALRRLLLRLGAFLSVHELPAFTFPGIEARVYLTVFERSTALSALVLKNHRLVRPDIRTLALGHVGPKARLDYAYHEACERLARVQRVWSDCTWRTLDSLTSVSRGRTEATGKTAGVLHTTCATRGFWRVPARPWQPLVADDGVRTTDLLLARVHRTALATLGPPRRAARAPLSKCVLRIRPAQPEDAPRLLFALRVLLHPRLELAALLVRGAGARYIARNDLQMLSVPMDLADQHPRHFRKYCDALDRRDSSALRHIEDTVARQTLRRVRADTSVPVVAL
jgi:hypothetical protein